MFVIIIVTSLITVIILIITSAAYLISLICDGSDDANYDQNSLALDSHDFSSTPTVSPHVDVSYHNATCEHHNHHQDETHASVESTVGQRPPVHESYRESDINGTRVGPSTVKGLHKQSEGQHKAVTVDAARQKGNMDMENVHQNGAWPESTITQKNIISNQLGAPASKQLFEDFDSKEMQHGGTGLHWCKTRRSLDKLVKLGVPLNGFNRRHETPLHVAVRRRKLQLLIGLLCHGADVEIRNGHGETPLLLSAKVNDIYACQLLLVFDAQVNAADNLGFTARHYAASICERHKTQQQLPSAGHLILAMLNEMGANRCSECPNDSNSTKTKGSSHCSPGCSVSGTYNGNSYNRWPSYQKESLYKRYLFSDTIEAGSRRKRSSDDSLRSSTKRDSSSFRTGEDHRQSRLLCIDGGGLRGVIVCQVLIEIEKYLKRPIISYFDWIGGTSVGAFMSCALCLGTSLRQLRRITFDVKDEVFSGNKPYNSKFLERVLKRTFGASARLSDVKDKKLAVTTVVADRDPCQLRFFRNYKSPADLLESHGYAADIFNNMSGHSIVSRKQSNGMPGNKPPESANKNISSKTIVSSRSKSNGNSRSTVAKEAATYNQTNPLNNSSHNRPAVEPKSNSDISDEDLSLDDQGVGTKDSKSNNLTIEYVIDENDRDPLMWQAVRASAAAPFFFKPYGPYLDGGIISNNPTLDIMAEFFSYQKAKSFLRARTSTPFGDPSLSEPPSKLTMVVSLGTGRGRVVGRQAMVDFGNVATGFATVFSPVELLRSIRAVREMFRKLVQQSCHTEDHILDRAQAWCTSLEIPYFRINPPLTNIFSIDDKRDEQLVNALWHTKLYMRAMRSQLEQLSDLLNDD